MTVNELKQEIGFDPNYNSDEENTAKDNNAASPKKEEESNQENSRDQASI